MYVHSVFLLCDYFKRYVNKALVMKGLIASDPKSDVWLRVD